MSGIKPLNAATATQRTANKPTPSPTPAIPPAKPEPAAPSTPTERFQTTARQGSAQTTQSLFQESTAPVAKVKAPAKTKPLTASEQLTQMAQKYGVTVPAGESVSKHQSTIIKAMVKSIGAKYGVPEKVALGVSGHESGGWKMWRNVDKGTVVKGVNPSSVDWGVMQINDDAHPRAFPKAKKDIEYNIEYGMKFLAEQHKHFAGSLNMGFGDWDKTLASYNLGHAPSKSELNRAQRYLKGISQYADGKHP